MCGTEVGCGRCSAFAGSPALCARALVLWTVLSTSVPRAGRCIVMWPRGVAAVAAAARANP
eukprot:16433056-Heterocapsa_arctica.AAC.1